MNILKFGRGDFFGIMIPGIFLGINILCLFPGIQNFIIAQLTLQGQQDYTHYQTMLEKLKESATYFIPLILVISYILGFALRLIRPTILERIGFLFLIVNAFVIAIQEFLKDKRKQKKQKFEVEKKTEEPKFWGIVKKHIIYCWEAYPYINWFYEEYVPNSQSSFREFYNNILRIAFKNDKDKMKSQTFINQCKLVVIESSNKLNEEILFSEGIVRFLSGMSCALIISIGLILYQKFDFPLLLTYYVILQVWFNYKLRHIRAKEVQTIFTSYWIVSQNEKQKKLPLNVKLF